MFVRVVPLSSSRDVKCVCVSRYLSPVVEICSRARYLLYVKCLCVLSRYLSPVVEICYMLNVCVCCLVISPVVEICYMLNVCACCPVISASSRDLLCLCVLSR